MKYFFVTDLHGSAFWAQKCVDKFEKSGANVMYLLGDVYYHGPRNPLPQDYLPSKVATILNGIADKLIVVSGNCDSQVDTLVSNFNFVGDVIIPQENGSRLYLTHGHIFDETNLPHLQKGDVLMHGHFHVNTLQTVNGVAVVGLASLSLPKPDNVPSYALLEDGKLEVREFDSDQVLFSIEL